MTLKIVRLFFFCFIFSSTVLCQESLDFNRVSKHKFSDGKIVSKLHKFEYIFFENKNDRINFKKFNGARKTQRIFNYSLVGIAASIVIVDIVSTEDYSGSGSPLAFDGVVSLIGSVATCIAAIITNSIIGSIKRKRKRRLLFDFFISENQREYGKMEIQLKFEQSFKKIALTYEF